MHRTGFRYVGLILGAAILPALCGGCASTPGGSVALLSGYWTNSNNAQLSASPDSAVFALPCERAVFAPLAVDSTGAFAATSTSFLETGNVLYSPGDELRIQGRLANNEVTLQLYVVRTSPPVSDPIVMTLSPGGSRSTPVCTA